MTPCWKKNFMKRAMFSVGGHNRPTRITKFVDLGQKVKTSHPWMVWNQEFLNFFLVISPWVAIELPIFEISAVCCVVNSVVSFSNIYPCLVDCRLLGCSLFWSTTIVEPLSTDSIIMSVRWQSLLRILLSPNKRLFLDRLARRLFSWDSRSVLIPLSRGTVVSLDGFEMTSCT